MSEKNSYHCPACGIGLRGGLVLIIIETDQASSETLYESPWRNWMKCRFCQLTLCKDCGTSADNSYCHPCREREGIKPMPTDLTHRVKLTVRKEEIICDELIADEERVF
jgi:hypothetical protein